MAASVDSVCQKKPRLLRVGKVRRKNVRANRMAQAGVFQPEHHLDTFVEVPRHRVGAAQINFAFSAIAKYENPAVLEESADDAAHAYPAADAAQSRPKRAGSSHDQFNVDAGLRRAIKRLDDVLVQQRIHFRDDETPGAWLSHAAFHGESD